MAEQDSFIQEVTEEVRRDRMYSVWKKYGPIAIAAVVLMVVGTAAKGWWDGRIETHKQELGSKLVGAANMEDPADAAEAFASLAAEGEYAYPALARLRAAASFAAAGEPDRAIEVYEQVKADDMTDERLRELAELRIVMLLAETAEPSDLLARLGTLTAPGAPWRLPALEFEAATHLRAGNAEAAIATLQKIIEADTALPTAVARARELNDAITSALEDQTAIETPEQTDNSATEASEEPK